MQIYDNKCFHKVKTHAVIMQLCQEYGKMKVRWIVKDERRAARLRETTVGKCFKSIFHFPIVNIFLKPLKKLARSALFRHLVSHSLCSR